MTGDPFRAARRQVRALQQALGDVPVGGEAALLTARLSPSYHWQGVHPFNEQHDPDAVAATFWTPLRQSLTHLARREDIFLSGQQPVDDSIWTISMGHFMGLFDAPFIGIPATGRIAMLRYAEFQQVRGGEIVAGAMFCDLLGLMSQAGVYPLGPETGVHFVYPGPRTHDGIQLEGAEPAETVRTLALVEAMIEDLSALNQSGESACTPEVMARSWHPDMVWYGPAGIGASYTIPRYQQQHQIPFRAGLKDKVFNGHRCRIAEGSYAGFYGWPNLSNTPTGGFLGLPGSDIRADMRVADIYRREGDRLAENWVLIDLPHWLLQQGLDVFTRLDALTAARQG